MRWTPDLRGWRRSVFVGTFSGATAIVVRAERLLVGLLRPSILLGCMRRGWPLAGILNSPKEALIYSEPVKY